MIRRRVQSLLSRALGLGDPGELRTKVDETHRHVLEINHNLLDIQRRFEEVSADVETISALTLSMERTSREIAGLTGAQHVIDAPAS